MRHRLWALALAAGWLVQAAPLRSTLDDQKALAVTVYNGDLALVKDTRRLTLPAGESVLELRDVSAQIRLKPHCCGWRRATRSRCWNRTSTLICSRPPSCWRNTSAARVRVVAPTPRRAPTAPETARVLAAAGRGAEDRRSHRDRPAGAPGVRRRAGQPARPPTLAVTVNGDGAGQRALELSVSDRWPHLAGRLRGGTGGKRKELALSGWVTLTNRSGTAYRNARLQLVAGDVNQVEPALRRGRVAETMMAKSDAGALREESLLDYHPTRSAGRPRWPTSRFKQVALLAAPPCRCRRNITSTVPVLLRHAAGRGRHPAQGGRAAASTTAGGRARPAAAGRRGARHHQRDSAGGVRFIGEDRIDHAGERDGENQTRRRLRRHRPAHADRLQGADGRQRVAAALRERLALDFKNARKVPVVITVDEPLPGDWEIVDDSQPHQKFGAHGARWRVTIPPGGKRSPPGACQNVTSFASSRR